MQNKFEGSSAGGRTGRSDHIPEPASRQGHRTSDRDSQYSRPKGKETERERPYEGTGMNAKDHERRVANKPLELKDSSSTIKRSRPGYSEPDSRDERDWRSEKISRKHESESYHREEKYCRERDSRSGRDRDTTQHHHRRDER